MKRVLIVAGDPSGDLVASQLVESLKKLDSSLKVDAVGGKNLKNVADTFLADIVHQHAIGFAISIEKILFFKNILNNIIDPLLISNPPDVVIPVDFYGFNGRLAKLAKKRNCPVFYYVSPQFWASRPWRVETLRKSVDQFLCLFPFELEFYKQRNLPAVFVGHPLIDRVPQKIALGEWRPRIEPTIGLLPGSRPNEIRRHLPEMVKACRIISENYQGARYLLFTVPHVHPDIYKAIIDDNRQGHFLIELIQDENYAWRAQLDFAMTASGLETLENTFLGIPMVVMYKMDWITYVVARLVIRTPYIGLPNILAKKWLVPELIQTAVRPEAIASPILSWIKNPEETKKLRSSLFALRDQFGGSGASDRAAKVILESLELEKVA